MGRAVFREMEQQAKCLCTKNGGENPSITHQRQINHLRKAVQCLKDFLEDDSGDLAISAHHLRNSARQLGLISGKVYTEQILDVIFKDFCIGK